MGTEEWKTAAGVLLCYVPVLILLSVVFGKVFQVAENKLSDTAGSLENER